MDKINEMKARKAQIVMESRALLDRVEAEKREFSAEERASYDKMFADIEAINVKIKDEERLLLAEADIRGFEKAESGKVETTPEERRRLSPRIRAVCSKADKRPRQRGIRQELSQRDGGNFG
jgi:hypothetical protein